MQMTNHPSQSSQPPTKIHKISAMELRIKPGSYLDRCDYLEESFIIKRGTMPKAVLIPYQHFSSFQLLNQHVQRLQRELLKLKLKPSPAAIP